jgi:ubiquinone biosynthesis protein Coq4
VVTGFATDVAGELGLQAFYLAQFPGRLAMLLLPLGMLNTMLYARDDVGRRMDEITRGWQMGRAARRLFGIDWSSMWDQPLHEIRAGLKLEVGQTVGTAAA